MKKPSAMDANSKFRKKAETVYLKKHVKSVSNLEDKKLLYELQIHQIELEMQNEELTMLRHRAELMLENFTILFNYAPIAYLTIAKDSLILDVNYAAIKLFNQSITKLRRQRLGVYVVDEFKPIFNDFVERAFNSHQSEHCEVLFNIDDKSFWLMLSGIVASSKEFLLVTALDLSERKLEEDKQKFASMVYESLDEPIMVLDKNNIIIAINSAFTKLTGFSTKQTIGQPMWFFHKEIENKKIIKKILSDLDRFGLWEGELNIPSSNGQENYQRLKINTVYDDNGCVLWHLAIFFDITQQKITENLIRAQANSDLLTGLPNRRSFQLILEKQLQKSKLETLKCAVIFLDIDKFKSVNDCYGHEVGDQLLKQTAIRLKKCVRQNDLVARFGGDEFIFLIKDTEDLRCIERVCQLILQVMRDPFYLGSHEIYITVSLGIAIFPNDDLELSGLLKKADQAMYIAKNKGRNCYFYFNQFKQ
jgi:diguanylate cyclase (GGDEF)-like protein/PAS domain S-box-containing protein